MMAATFLELERRGWVDSGSRREKVGTGKGSGQFTPEVAIERPDALRELPSGVPECGIGNSAGADIFWHPRETQ